MIKIVCDIMSEVFCSCLFGDNLVVVVWMMWDDDIGDVLVIDEQF